MTTLIDGGNWWAMVESSADAGPREVNYWKIVAWEKVDDVYGEDRAGLVAWINGREPIRSDQFSERVTGWVLNQYVHNLPERAKVSSWA